MMGVDGELEEEAAVEGDEITEEEDMPDTGEEEEGETF